MKMIQVSPALFLAAGLAILQLGCSPQPPRLSESSGQGQRARSQPLWGSFGTYDAQPRDQQGRVEVQGLISDLVDIQANTYDWLIWRAATDWEDLKIFLPLAREKGILVWVVLMPPTESPPHTTLYSEPFRLDFNRWAEEIARLSLQEPNLVAWCIDDFSWNLPFFSLDSSRKMLDITHRINPKLAFVPCCYFPSLTPAFSNTYGQLIDGILFPYRHESEVANLTNASLVEPEMQRIKEVMGPSLPIILIVYATAHSKLGKTTPDYVKQVMSSGWRSADGVQVYAHQDKIKDREKYALVKELFREWEKQPKQAP